MSLLMGAGALFAAFLLILFGRIALNTSAARPGDETFGPAEAAAFLFTVLVAAGIALMASATLDGRMPGAALQLAAALAALGGACTVTLLALRGFRPSPTPSREGTGGAPQRAGRPDAAPAPGRRGQPGRRAA